MKKPKVKEVGSVLPVHLLPVHHMHIHEVEAEEVGLVIRKARRESLRRLQKIQERLIERCEVELDGIKPRELLYNIDINNKIQTSMLDRDVPTVKDQTGDKVTIDGLSREQAIAMMQGCREVSKK